MIPIANRLNTVEEYYFSKKLKQVRQMILEGKPVLNMGIGSPDLPPHPSVIQALTASLFEEKAHEYQSYQGLPELREEMARFYQTHFNVNLNPSNEILPLMGSKEGILHICMAFLNLGDEVLIPNPGYPTYTSVTNLVEAVEVPYSLHEENQWQPNFEALEQKDLTKVKLMFVSYPHMPTGAVATKDLFQKLIDFGKKHSIIIVNDNPYSFVLNNNPISILHIDGAKDIAIELNSLSKTYNMAGWRVGMVCGAAPFLEAILKVKSNMDSGMFFGIQKGAIKALQLDKSWFVSLNEIYNQRRNLIFELATKIGCTFNKESVGLFVWAKLPKGVTSAEDFVETLLLQKNIFLTPGTVFGSNGEGYIRFSLCIPENKIQEAIDRF